VVIAGTSLGVGRPLPPLGDCATPFLRRLVEKPAMREVTRGIVEATQAARRHTPADRLQRPAARSNCGHHRQP